MTVPTYEYKIGTTHVGMVTLASLGIPAPKNNFVPFSSYITLATGATQGNGWATDSWSWGFIQSAWRVALRVYIPSAGAHIFIRDLKDDGVTWADFECEAEWPQREERVAGRRIPFALDFRAMIELA